VKPGSLLDACRNEGAYADTYAVEIARDVPMAMFIEAFYTTPLFKAERLVLALLAAPSTDGQARALATGRRDTFAAWTVEHRADDEILLAALRTRSWLAVEPGTEGTRLLFGSAVMPRRNRDGDASLGAGFTGLLGLHRLYSRALLASALARLEATPDPG
jgi:hypothetical protein